MGPRLSLVAVVAAGLLVTPARAASYTCPLVTDPRGDTGVAEQMAPTGSADADPSEDILSADLWSDGRTLTGVVRLATLPSPGELALAEPQGHAWIVSATRYVGDTGYDLWLELVERSGSFYADASWHPSGSGLLQDVPGVTYAVDHRTSSVRISVPLASYPAELRMQSGARLSPVAAYALRVTTAPWDPRVTANPGGLEESRDRAETRRTVVVGRPQCASA